MGEDEITRLRKEIHKINDREKDKEEYKEVLGRAIQISMGIMAIAFIILAIVNKCIW